MVRNNSLQFLDASQATIEKQCGRQVTEGWSLWDDEGASPGMCSPDQNRADTGNADSGTSDRNSVGSGDQEQAERRSRQSLFWWRCRCTAVKEEKLPRRSPEDELAAMNSRTEVEEAVEVDLQRRKNRVKTIIALVIVCIVIAVIVDLSAHNNVKNWLEGAMDWIEDNPKSGVVVFALVFCVATLIFIPGLILTIGAGVVFGEAFGFLQGLIWGTVAVLLGAFVACVIAFYVGRYVMHDCVQKYSKRYRVLGAVNKAIETNGVKVMFLLRLSPLVPFSGFNMIAGVTKASFRDYLIGCLGIIPGTVAFVFIGASTAGTMHEEGRMGDEGVNRTACIIRITLLVFGSVAAVLALVAVTWYARRALKEALEESNRDARTESESADVQYDEESGSSTG